MNDDGFEGTLPPERFILGPCPVCRAWQVEYDSTVLLAEVEEALLEHDNEDHPGALVAMARAKVSDRGPVVITRVNPQEGWT